MPIYNNTSEYEISTRNIVLKHNLKIMFDKYGIKDYAMSTKTSWSQNPLEIFPSKHVNPDRNITKNALDSIDDLVLYQYLRLEEEIRNHPFYHFEFEDEDIWNDIPSADSIMKNFNEGFSYLYLMKEEKPEKSFQLFRGFLQEGVNGLCISQCDPQKLYNSYGIHAKDIVTLCNSAGENNINPRDLSKLLNRINEFIHENSNSVILIDGLEYLIVKNGLKKVLEILNTLNSKINKDSMFILPIRPKALGKNDFDQLEKSIVH
jgi:hypothetical protein